MEKVRVEKIKCEIWWVELNDEVVYVCLMESFGVLCVFVGWRERLRKRCGFE